MEQRTISERDLEQVIDKYVGENYEKEAVALAKEDLTAGVPKDLVALYMDKRLSVAQMQQYSRAMRAGLSEDFIRMLKDGNFKYRQLEVIIDFHLKGVPMESIGKEISSDMEPHAIHKALTAIYEQLEKAKATVPQGNEEAKEICEKIEKMLSGIGDNSNYLQAVMDKLGTLDSIAQGNDDVRETLSKSIEEKERIINEQQAFITQATKENGELRRKLQEISESKNSFEKKQLSYEKEMESLRAENEALRKEKEDMVREITDKEKELAKKEEDMALVQSRPRVPNVNYDTVVVGGDGRRQSIHVEHTSKRSPEGLLALAGKKLFGKSKVNLIKQLTGKGLNQQQMEQIKVAIESGLTDEEVIDIINSGFSAEEMKQAIEIVIAEKMYQ